MRLGTYHERGFCMSKKLAAALIVTSGGGDGLAVRSRCQYAGMDRQKQ